MIDGLPWGEVLRDFARTCGWTADQVLFGHTLGQFLGVWCQTTGDGDPDRIKDRINRLRAKKGLPPMKPQG